jgi:creatinine amidohydrolase
MPQSLASLRFDELTDPEIAARLAARPLVLIPCGSTEQHGPHLPTSTDYLASLAICDLVAAELGGLVLAGMQFGVTPIHMGFAGTVSLSASTFEQVLYEMVSSLAAHGVREVAFVNWHEGNISSLANLGSRLTQELGLNVVLAQACYVAEELFGEELGGLTHGGAIEGAAVLGARPELAHYERLATAASSPGERPADRARRTKAFQSVLKDIREISDTGWYGSASEVSRDQGSALVKAVADVVAGELAARFSRLAEMRPSAS